MNIAIENLFPLIAILCIAIFLIVRNLLTGKVVYYPSIRYFKGSKTRQGNIPGMIKEILKFIFFIIFLVSLLIYFLKPNILSKQNEYAIIIIDKTPYIEINNVLIERITDSLMSQGKYNNFLVKEICSSKNELLKKQRIIEQIFEARDQYSGELFLISDREYNNNCFSLIKTKSNFPEIMITDIKNIITVYSKIDTIINFELFLHNAQVFKKYVELNKGINSITVSYEGFFNKIIAHYDTLIIPEKIQLQSIMVNDKTNNNFIRKILKVLGYKHSKNGEITISYEDDIKKGIVISQYGDTYVKKGDRSFLSVNNNIPIDLEFSHLKFKKITINKGNPVIMSSFGECIISNDDNRFYINIPADTGLSNLFLLPETVILFDILISDYNEHIYENSLLAYRSDIINNNDYSYSAEYEHPSRNIEHIFLYIACIAFILFTLISIL